MSYVIHKINLAYNYFRMMTSDNGGPMLSPIYDKQQQNAGGRLPPPHAEIPAVGEFLDSSKDR